MQESVAVLLDEYESYGSKKNAKHATKPRLHANQSCSTCKVQMLDKDICTDLLEFKDLLNYHGNKVLDPLRP